MTETENPSPSPSPHDDPLDETQNDAQSAVLKRPQLKKPSLYRVLLINDDYTPMEFVILVLQRFFGKNQGQATEIMLKIHQQGVGTCGVYTYDVAQTKVALVLNLARNEQHPLQCVLDRV